MNVEPTIVDAMRMWSNWHVDISPMGETGDAKLDRRLGDAFRMMLYYRDRPRMRRWWLTRQIYPRFWGNPLTRYEAEMVRWYNCLYELEARGEEI